MFIAVALGTVPSAFAVDLNLAGFTEAAYASNADRSPTDEKSGVRKAAGLNLTANETTRRLTLQTGYRVIYNDYANDTNKDDTVATGNTSFRYMLVQNRLFWRLNHQISQVLTNQSDVDTPDNRGSRQTIATGPEFTVPVTSRVNMNGSLIANRVEYSRPENDNFDSDPDTTSYNANTNFSYSLSALSRLSVGASYSELDRDDSDFTQEYTSYYVGFNRKLRQLSYNATVGYNEFTLSDSDSGADGNFFRLGALWQGVNQTVQLTAAQRNSSNALRNNNFSTTNAQNIFSNFSTEGSSDLNLNASVRTRGANFEYSHAGLCAGCTLGFESNYNWTDYRQVIGDDGVTVENANQPTETVIDASMNFKYELNQRQSIGFGGERKNISFRGDTAEDFSRTTITASYEWKITPKLTMDSRISWFKRDNENSSDRDFDNLTARLNLSYNFINRTNP